MKKPPAGQQGESPRDAELSRLYADAPSESPPAELDTAIVAAARRAVHAKPRAAGPFARRWAVPFSVAAVVVVSVTLVTLSQREQYLERTDASRPERRVSRAVSGKVETEAPGRAAPSAPTLEQAPASTMPAGTPVADQPAARILKKSRAKSDVARKEKRGRAAPAPAPLLQPIDSLTERARPARPASAAGATGFASDSTVPAAPAAVEQERTPRAWLKHIRALFTQGRRQEARMELARFRRRFPDYPVPSELSR